MLNHDEVERLAALRRYHILDTPAEEAFDRIAALAADLFNTPIAAISLIDADRQWFKAKVGLEAAETRREDAFCSHTICDDKVMVVTDAEQDARFRDNPLVTGDLSIRFYAGAPLTLPSGERLGALCVIDRKPHPPLTNAEKRRLATLAAIVVGEMDLRLTNEQLTLMTRQAEAANDAKSEFLANMTHELRTPLTSVIGFNGLLAASPALPARERALAEKARAAGEKLLTIVNDVLDLARLESAPDHTTPEPTDVAEVARSACDLFTERAAEKGLTFRLDIADGLPKASADPIRLRQVLVNLLGNAVKFTAQGGVTLSARAEGDRVLLSVADTGIGIPPEQIDKVFERFEQGGAQVALQYGGTGLGLAISRRLAEQMGGAITVKSRVGEGSVFTLALKAA